MNFRKLRLTGFKSFVESTELLIEPGLTGIVGPNGCGKSNLVEALRWVMGETSARQLRGGEMDDVIFGGTSHRPSRNLAEVVLHLDNGDRRAPAQFNDHDELEVVRRISRGSGSVYRVNGREVRARDVQLLFADAASGARSTAMVSQGQIGAFIAAKPTQRRAVLEEAAGITGLHSRRHEAELRLRAAEANLERLEDVLTTLDSQLQGLRKQARQANRYRRLNEHIRRAEAQLFHVRWARIGEEAAAAEAALEAARRRVVEATGAAAAAGSAQSEAAAAVPPAREGEAAAAAELQRLLVARDGLAAEETRIAEARRAADARLLQARQDLERERSRAADAAAALERLEAERAALVEAGAGETAELADSKARLDAVQGEVAGLDAEAGRLTRQIADAEAGRAALARQITEARGQVDRLRRQLDEARRQHSGAAAQAIDPAAVAAAEAASATAEAAVHAAQAEGDAAAEATVAARRDESAARERVQATQAELARLRAEEAAIAGLLAEGDGDRWPPVIDSLRVDPGFESALGAALGDDLNAATDAAAPAFWTETGGADAGAAPALPAGAVPLSGHVHGAPVLVPRLEQVGVVDDAAAALAMRRALAVGQRLVSRDGGLWRWDGYTVAPGADSPAAKRLAQRNRLDAVRRDLPAAEAADLMAREALAGAQAAMRAAGEREARAREAARTARADVDRLRRAHADLAQRAAVQQSRLAALADTVTRLETEAAEAGRRADGLTASAAASPDPAEAKAQAEALRARLAERREALLAARTDHDRLGREIETRRRRIAAVADEALSWRRRADEAAGQRDTLEARALAEAATVAELAAQPAELAARRAALLDRIEASQTRRKAAGDRLAEAEAALVERDRAAKQAESRLVELREAGIRAESAVERVRQASDALVERVLERLDCRPEMLGELAGLDAGETPPDVDELERRAERLLRERDGMGAVNLRAEQESEALAEQLASLQAEREDLLAAIAKLRRGIAELNREGRQRLLVAFEQVNAHFMELFVRLFGGGEAHLALTESDDPLEAGLEIMASPPGKKMQILSLLSGGERALTALALLFAVFLTNPAPICVLDEVDAPLDDANVDRFCRMLEEIGRASSTRFLVVTHHRLTMARMDRLFGVTMAERGVSQLVSVDLRRAEGLRAIA